MTGIPQRLDNHLRKPTALIHFERSLSVVEQKVMTLIIFHCQMAEKDAQGFYYIKKNFVREFLGWDDSHNYPRIYEAFLGIYNNSIQWNLLGADRTFKGGMCRLIVSLLEPTETGQYIGFKLHPDLEPLIKDPRVFAKLKLVMMVLLSRSQYAYPLYELFADSYSRGQSTLRIPLTTLKSYLGIGADSYKIFKDFKTWVLKPNLDSLNVATDFRVEYATYRAGRSIGGLVFHLRKQPWQPPALDGPLRELLRYYQQLSLTAALESPPSWSPEEQDFIRLLQQDGLTEADAVRALETHGLEGAGEIRDYVRAEVDRRRGQPEEIRNTSAYLARCFREGYGKKTAEERTAERRQRNAIAIAQAQQDARERRHAQAADLVQAFRQHQAVQVEERLAALSAPERQDLDRAFIRSQPIWAKGFREGGSASPLARAAFQQFAAERLLAAEERDLEAFARARGASIEVINLLRMAA
jgi:hypothetical protein